MAASKEDVSSTSEPKGSTSTDEISDSVERKLPWYKFNNVPRAQGYATLGMSRGALVMSNIFLSTAFIFLASEDAGCLTESGDEVVDSCDNKVYGFRPASFIANIAVISGLLSALLMPFFGAMIDYTPHRRQVGIWSAVLMMIIQTVQIYTVQETWFAMAILQSIAGFLYQVQVLSCYAYLPEMARDVGQKVMTNFSSSFTMIQFSAQCGFIVVVTALGQAFQLTTVEIGQWGQAVNALWSGAFFFFGWRLLPHVEAKSQLPEGKSLLATGFNNVFKTVRKLNNTYRTGLRWFLLGVVFAEAAANAFTVVAVVYLDEQIGLSASAIGIFFLISLLGSLPGSVFGAWVTKKTNPKRSYQMSMFAMMVVAAGGALILDHVPGELSYIWGVVIGVMLGWFYPTEGVFFSMCLPKGQEAELSGFFVYCTQILGWLPPLVFAFLVEANVSQTYAVMAVAAFFCIAIVIIELCAPWDEILEETAGNSSTEERNESPDESHDV